MNGTFFRKIFGWILLVVGFVALVTPFTPGGWLVFIGAEILGIEMLSQERVKVYYQKLKERFFKKKEEEKKEDGLS